MHPNLKDMELVLNCLLVYQVPSYQITEAVHLTVCSMKQACYGNAV